MRKAMLWKSLGNDRTLCQLCSHFCTLAHEETGKCGVRRNTRGILHTLVDEHIAALGLDPVEKKPLYHFYPGSQTLSIGTAGCNLTCKFCQNHSLSQDIKKDQSRLGRRTSAQELVDLALQHQTGSISYTYSEPTVFFELMFETATLAKKHGLQNIMVSNGFMSLQCLDKLANLIDAVNIDLKAFSEDFYQDFCGASLKPVLKNLRKIKEMGWWLEITTLIIPGLNDTRQELQQIAAFIAKELDPDTPWHISRFHPAYQMPSRKPTPLATLEETYALAQDQGLHFVYLGNVYGHTGEDTICPACKQTLIRRQGFSILNNSIVNGACPGCKTKLPGLWQPA